MAQFILKWTLRNWRSNVHVFSRFVKDYPSFSMAVMMMRIMSQEFKKTGCQ